MEHYDQSADISEKTALMQNIYHKINKNRKAIRELYKDPDRILFNGRQWISPTAGPAVVEAFAELENIIRGSKAVLAMRRPGFLAGEILILNT